MNEHQEALERIAAFITAAYDQAAQTWMVFGGTGGINGGATYSSSALAVETWSYLQRAGVITSKLTAFGGVVDHVRHQLAERLPACLTAENATLELSSVRSVPLFHFTLLHCIKALIRTGVRPGDPRVFAGLRALAGLQQQDGGFRYGAEGEPLLWATVEAITCLTDVEQIIATEPRDFTSAVLAGLSAFATSATERMETKEAFLASCTHYCKQQLVGELRLKNTAYDTEGCFLIGETGMFFGHKVHVIAAYFTSDITEDIVHQWLLQADNLRANHLVVLTNRRLAIEQYRMLWSHNASSKRRVEGRTV